MAYILVGIIANAVWLRGCGGSLVAGLVWIGMGIWYHGHLLITVAFEGGFLVY